MLAVSGGVGYTIIFKDAPLELLMSKLTEYKHRPQMRELTSANVLERPWGEELLLGVSSGNYTFKKLMIRAGEKGGLQYHRMKDEMAFVCSGELIVRYVDERGILSEKLFREGQAFHFPPGCIHQEEAVTDCMLLEVSTPYLNDRVRVDRAFGLVELGLPTTDKADIVGL